MITTSRFPCLASFYFLASGLLPGFGGADEIGAENLKAAYVSALADIEAPQRALLAKYRENLQSLLDRKRAAGDFEAALAATREMESGTSRGPRDFASQPELKRLREIYDTALARLQTAAAPDLARLHETHRAQALSRVESLTRAGRIEEAKEINAWLEELEEEAMASPRVTREGKLLWELKSRAGVEPVAGCEMKASKAGFELTSPGGGNSWMKSRREFSPPFRIVSRVATDSTNIRFYYRSHLVILNWEVNPTALRIHHPGEGKGVGFPGKGEVSRGEMHDIEIDVLLDKVAVKVDGKLRAELATPCAGLEGAVGLGPAFGSIVTVESFRIVAVE